jgi:plasmid stabilization system protein ParE
LKVRWTAQAVDDLIAITRFISRDSPKSARMIAHKLKMRAESVCRFPARGRVVPELERDDIRELIEGSYRIIYTIKGDTIDILTIFEGHRLFTGLTHGR